MSNNKIIGHKKIYKQLLKETKQAPEIRQNLIKNIEKEMGKTVISFCTSFQFPVMIDDQDAVMIEELLQNIDIKKKGLLLIINSPGGSGLAAERIINVCRSYSNNNFNVIIPNRAKSAATMVCLGSFKIMMSKTSELGPIDPQVAIRTEDGKSLKRLSIHSILESYRNLFEKAVKTKGKMEPFLQQLNRYDARDIEEFSRAMELSESIAIKYLINGMMKGEKTKDIKKKIEPFLSHKKSKSHGRPIFLKEAKDCGLEIEEIELGSKLWKLIWELFLRTEHVLKTDCAKIIESQNEAFSAKNPLSGVEK